MRSTTNLHWPTEPYGASQRPLAKDSPMMAAVDVGLTGYVRRPEWACVVYFRIDSTRALSLDGSTLNIGYEVLTRQADDSTTTLPERFDEILVASRRRAKFLAGHNLADDLAALVPFSVDRRLPGVETVHQNWTARHTKERGTARLVDTARDVDLPGVTDLAEICKLRSLKVASVEPPAGTAEATTVRQALTRTLAIGLIAAAALGRYDWTEPVDVDEIVNAAAWDHLDELAMQAASHAPAAP